ncbi:MAG: hypothetical protein HY690_10545 [Chloroflexi bacterium]|nr:hypothetical protein [Chloroflexota bacterium]
MDPKGDDLVLNACPSQPNSQGMPAAIARCWFEQATERWLALSCCAAEAGGSP